MKCYMYEQRVMAQAEAWQGHTLYPLAFCTHEVTVLGCPTLTLSWLIIWSRAIASAEVGTLFSLGL